MSDDSRSTPALSAEAAASLKASYLRVRFRGGRFEGDGGMPLAAIQELGFLDSLINELGRHLWRRYKQRERLNLNEYPNPPALRVKTFSQGSSIPLIERDKVIDDALIPDPYDPYEASRDLIEQAFWSIVDSSEIPIDFPVQYVPQLKRVGKSLRDDETQEFLEFTDTGDWVARGYTRQKRIDFWSEYESRTTEYRSFLGHILKLERNKELVFEFKDLNTGQKLEGLCGQHWDNLWDALGKSDSQKPVRLYATVQLDYLGRTRKILDLSNVEVLDMEPNHWTERFKQIASQQECKSTGASLVLSSNLERTDAVIRKAAEAGLSIPAVFPSSDGGTNLVWDRPIGRVTVYIEDDEDFEVEMIPDGPIMPFSADTVSEVVQKVKEYFDA